MSSLLPAYTPAMQRLLVWHEDLYKQVSEVLDSVALTGLQGVSSSFNSCTSADRARIKHLFQEVRVQLPSDAQRNHEPAVLDMICCAYLKRQVSPDEFPYAEMVGQELRSRNLVQTWQTVFDRSTTHESVGQKYSEFFESRTVSSTFRRLMQESLVFDSVYRGRLERKEDFVARGADRFVLAHDPGHYMIVLTDPSDLSWYRMYVGQAADVQKRLQGHEARKREKALTESPTPLYRLWNVPGRVAHYLRLTVHSADFGETEKDKNSWLCLVELFYALFFQTLQPQLLSQLLGRPVPSSLGLNVQSPLQQGETFRGKDSGFGALFASDDKEIRDGAFGHMDRIRPLGQKVLRDDGHAKNARGIFLAKGSPYLRQPRAGDPDPVMIRCNGCKSQQSIRQDTAPKFCKITGKYVERQSRCEGTCSLNASEKKAKRTKPNRYHEPINLSSDQWVKNKAHKKFIAKNPFPHEQPSAAETADTEEQIQVVSNQSSISQFLVALEPEGVVDSFGSPSAGIKDESSEHIMADILEGLEPEDFEDDFDAGSLVDQVEMNVDVDIAALLEGIDPAEFDDELLID